MASIKDLKLNPPTKKTELTKDNMIKFIKDYGTIEDKKWFLELLDANTQNKINNLTKEVVVGYDLPKIREAFAIRFFENISSKAKKDKKTTTKKATFKDELEELRKMI